MAMSTTATSRALKRRAHHETRIDTAGSQRRELMQAWAWLRAEVSQFHADEALRIIRTLAIQLNRGEVPRDDDNER